MNKQEAIELLRDVAKRAYYRTGRRSIHIDEIVELVNQIDEPVEKEPLYTVEIPNPNSAGGKLVLFKQQSSGRLILDMLNHNINKPKYLHLTESEIKQDFDFLWQFAKEVE